MRSPHLQSEEVQSTLPPKDSLTLFCCLCKLGFNFMQWVLPISLCMPVFITHRQDSDEHKMATERHTPTNSGIWHSLFSVTEFGRPPIRSQFIICFRQSPFIHQFQCWLGDRMIRHANHHLWILPHILLGGWAANALQKRKRKSDKLKRGRCCYSCEVWKGKPHSTVRANACQWAWTKHVPVHSP